jgi:hypothetical protein
MHYSSKRISTLQTNMERVQSEPYAWQEFLLKLFLTDSFHMDRGQVLLLRDLLK